MGEKGQQTLETDGLIHHTPEINKKKKAVPSFTRTAMVVNSTTVETCQAIIHIPILQSLGIAPER